MGNRPAAILQAEAQTITEEQNRERRSRRFRTSLELMDYPEIVNLEIAADLNAIPTLAEQAPKKYENLSLEQLSGEIQRLHVSTQSYVAGAKIGTRSALLQAIEAGKALSAAKIKVTHGKWTGWLKEKVPWFSHDQANRYMKLAREIPHVRNFEELASLRKAYMAIGILPPPASGSDSHQNGAKKPWSLARVVERLRNFSAQLAKIRHEELSQPLRKMLLNEIQQHYDILRDVEGRLNAAEVAASDNIEAQGS